MESITQIWKRIQAPDFSPERDSALVEQVKQAANQYETAPPQSELSFER